MNAHIGKVVRFALSVIVTAATGMGQEPGVPELTLNQAIEQAVATNSALKTASLETVRAADDLAANRTRRFANTQIIALGAQLLTKPSVTFPQGALGVYPALPDRPLEWTKPSPFQENR
jgi:hypothetical protein